MKAKQKPSQLPEVNLVPMMDVLMTVLTFFVIISISLTGGLIPNVSLPSTQSGVKEDQNANPFIIGLDRNKQVLIDNQPVTPEELAKKVQQYLKEEAEGEVIIKADRSLPYQEVAKLLKQVQSVGGDRVSLAVSSP
jgi:biopolymer transport protein ExbD